MGFLYDYGLINKHYTRSDFSKCVKQSTILNEVSKYVKFVKWEISIAKKIAFIAQNELEKSMEEYILI